MPQPRAWTCLKAICGSQAGGSVVSPGGDKGLTQSPEAHQNILVSAPGLYREVNQKGCDLEEAEGFRSHKPPMTHTSFKALCLSLALTSLHGIQASALTNQQLLQERLITPAVYVLLKSHGANTPTKRWEVIQKACGAGRLSPGECGTSRRRREY